MKRTFPQKVKPVSSQAADKETWLSLGLFKQAPEGNRRTHASAAMIGLAISMGASSMVLPQQGDGASAAEPKTVEAITPTALTTFENGTVESGIVVETSGAETETLRQSANQPESEVELFTQWQPSQTHELGKSALAAKNNIGYEGILSKETKIQSPNSSTITKETNAPATALSERDAFSLLTNSIQENQAAPEAAYVIESKIADEVSEIFAAKQNYIKANNKFASEQFEQSSNRLKDSLAEFGIEESVNSSEASAVSAPQKAAANEKAFPFINQANSSDGAKKQLDNSAAAKVSPSSVLIPLPGANELSKAEIPTNLPLGIPASEATASENVFSPFSPTNNNELEVPTLLPMPSQSTPQAETAVTVKENFLKQSLPTPEIVATPELETGEVTGKEKAVTTSDKVVTPDFSKAVALLPEQPQSVVEYKVRDGDTLDSLARTYGVTASVLAKYNQISDPNLLTVGQTLEIPLYQPGRQEVHTTALIEKYQPYGIASISYQPTKEVKADKQVPFVTLPNSTAIAYNPPVTLSREATTSEIESNKVEVELRSPTPSVANFPASEQPTNLEPATASYLYNNELISEMLKIREKYRSQKTVTPINAQASSLIAETNELVDEPANNKLTSARVNPEFLANQYPGTDQNQQSSAAPLSVPTKDTAPVATTPYEQEIVATAPTGTEAFESVIQPRMVSPELPPLASPDNYLPKGSAVFTGYIWPAKGVLTSGYGWRWGRMHKGIDIAGPVGTPIVAAAPGVITYARWNEGGYGNLVEITHPDGSVTLYAHNDRILVREGQEVEQGQQVAEMGSTGFSTGPHLHFEIHPPGQGAVNPLAYLP
ncbi:MAG: peptidoglycan DD-metalloendopeptidase family protein [Oscillatoriaceae bacterium SKW80]|nr:peptidoglycan DD-metalloendopeptidase family protein [Oscillatoriaceae bacterium SKYG93]MCX8119234.1 peptidoglycan DD-metalloendopeptidase family protein [Oscillatoriaceae bacterium SKW80]MDW8454701.1 peptidoglycan DD-metalloendopeptidase family protein [Oscillatoriaceae cyanobacterium SKYGB_i_bin93]HIK28517.1 peptidoglycan DD-metalloendopeptidase family protein [Oscillatoriaceae cyanobacterium M7585_C2015_266]